MSPIKLLALFAAFSAMWIGLEWAARRLASRSDRARVQSALDREQAAHDAFRRAAGRMGRVPE